MTALDEAEAYLIEVGLIDRPGAVLYSAETTLAPGPVYLMGLNPGGSEGAALSQSLEKSRSGSNAYLDEVWAPGGRKRPKGQALLQRRIQSLCARLGRDTRDVPASNLAFTRSTGVATHPGFAGAVKLCQPVHKIFMDAIKPKFVMTFGNLKHFEGAVRVTEIESTDADHQGWKAHRGTANAFGHKVNFGNVPHLSVWASEYRMDVVDWVLALA